MGDKTKIEWTDAIWQTITAAKRREEARHGQAA